MRRRQRRPNSSSPSCLNVSVALTSPLGALSTIEDDEIKLLLKSDRGDLPITLKRST